MVNDILRVVLLGEVHEDVVPVRTLEQLFGTGEVQKFRTKYPDIAFDEKYAGQGSRKEAERRRNISRRKFSRAQTLLKYISWVPWIRYAGVTGSVSFGNAEEQDDIDVFLVVQSKRLWLTRLAEQVIYRVAGARRSFGQSRFRDKLCINFYVSEEDLDVRDGRRDEFLTALELVMMKPVLDETYGLYLLSRNRWGSKYFPGSFRKVEGVTFRKRIPILSNIADIADLFVMKVWKMYMKCARHPFEDAVVERNSIQFVDKGSWTRRARKLDELLERYDVR